MNDPPLKWAVIDDQGYREIPFGESPGIPSPMDIVGGTDATPNRPHAVKMALGSIAKGFPPHGTWDQSAPPQKRLWLHMESILPPHPSYSAGATPAVIWGCLVGQPFPGEAALCEDGSLSKIHLEANLRLARASGHPSFSPTPLATTKNCPPPPPPGAGVGFFSWTKSLLPSAEDGPVGRGWGRVAEDQRRSYHMSTGRNDPGIVGISGFSYATTEGVVTEEFEEEGEAIHHGLEMISKARYTANVVVESSRSFKAFTVIRAAMSGYTLPDWLVYPPGRCWLSGLSKFAPPGESDPHGWIMRTGVACGEKTCSRMIPDPGAAWIVGSGNQGIAARTVVSAIVKSPYFVLGLDRAPDLIARNPLP